VSYWHPRRYSVTPDPAGSKPEKFELLNPPSPSDTAIGLNPEAARLLIDTDRHAVIQYAEWHEQQRGRLPACDGCGLQFVDCDPPSPPADDDLGLLEIVCTREGAYRFKCYCLKCARGFGIELETAPAALPPRPPIPLGLPPSRPIF
jgi:hypothetical protein